eukprot:TRINITY_DN2530_c0_g1_i6.p1 TRINITY_DN2530_c0_g1~~TRINITY_DN2530_c0_g1_i6.p1  ORF type:complete len:566 (-),score=49.85 TRINITY_DN2530_c0_g1_i6:105-1802(-)
MTEAILTQLNKFIRSLPSFQVKGESFVEKTALLQVQIKFPLLANIVKLFNTRNLAEKYVSIEEFYEFTKQNLPSKEKEYGGYPHQKAKMQHRLSGASSRNVSILLSVWNKIRKRRAFAHLQILLASKERYYQTQKFRHSRVPSGVNEDYNIRAFDMGNRHMDDEVSSTSTHNSILNQTLQNTRPSRMWSRERGSRPPVSQAGINQREANSFQDDSFHAQSNSQHSYVLSFRRGSDNVAKISPIDHKSNEVQNTSITSNLRSWTQMLKEKELEMKAKESFNELVLLKMHSSVKSLVMVLRAAIQRRHQDFLFRLVIFQEKQEHSHKESLKHGRLPLIICKRYSELLSFSLRQLQLWKIRSQDFKMPQINATLKVARVLNDKFRAQCMMTIKKLFSASKYKEQMVNRLFLLLKSSLKIRINSFGHSVHQSNENKDGSSKNMQILCLITTLDKILAKRFLRAFQRLYLLPPACKSVGKLEAKLERLRGIFQISETLSKSFEAVNTIFENGFLNELSSKPKIEHDLLSYHPIDNFTRSDIRPPPQASNSLGLSQPNTKFLEAVEYINQL